MLNKNYSEDYVTEEKSFKLTRGMVLLAAIILVILIVIIIFVINLFNKRKPQYTTKDFKYLEQRMIDEAPTYMNQKKIELSTNITRIDLKDLLTTNGGFIDPKRVKAAKICIGYVEAYKDDNINYNPYIKCDKYYITEGYKEELISTTTTLKDTEKPVITLNGDKIVNIYVGDKYEELGATAIDNIDKDITSKIKIEGDVNTTDIGPYNITYIVKDKAGNIAEEVRSVNIIEKEQTTVPTTKSVTTKRNITTKRAHTTEKVVTTKNTVPPTLVLNKGNYIEINTGESYIDPGYTATDSKGLNITGSVMVSGTVNTNEAGIYKLTYKVTDSYGNTTVKTRTVKVKSNYVRVSYITVTPNTFTINVGQTKSISVGFNPTNATNKSVTWNSSDSSIATVSNGVVKGVRKGVVTITVTSVDGPFKEIKVTVK